MRINIITQKTTLEQDKQVLKGSSVDSSSGVHDELKNALRVAEMLEQTTRRLRSQVNIIQGTQQRDEKRDRKRQRIIPPKFAENIFIITVAWQVMCLGVMELVDLFTKKIENKEKSIYTVGVAIMAVFQFTNLVISLVVTVKLTKQYMHHTATMKFLLQSYLSTLFLFGGIYTLIARVIPHAFEDLRGTKGGKYYALEIYSQLLFTSISTGTLCGAANVVAVHWFSEMLMGLQMMLSFVYFGSILSQVINPSLAKSSPDEKESNEVEKEKKKVGDILKKKKDLYRKTRYGAYEIL